MSDAGHIVGYAAISRAVSIALQRSACERTVKSWAHADAEKRPKNLRQRLPVYKFPDGRVYLLKSDLEAWARAWLQPMPTGAKA